MNETPLLLIHPRKITQNHPTKEKEETIFDALLAFLIYLNELLFGSNRQNLRITDHERAQLHVQCKINIY
jgi:hypothetical protein